MMNYFDYRLDFELFRFFDTHTVKDGESLADEGWHRHVEMVDMKVGDLLKVRRWQEPYLYGLVWNLECAWQNKNHT